MTMGLVVYFAKFRRDPLNIETHTLMICTSQSETFTTPVSDKGQTKNVSEANNQVKTIL